MKTKIFAAILGLMLAAVPLMAQQKETDRDEMILAGAIRAVQYNVYYTVYDNVELSVKDGVVTLTGQVTAPFKKSSFEKSILKRVEGVKGVDDRIEVLPVSSNDSRLRYFVARNIYSDSRMLRYSLESFPRSIHVIVKGGRVTLEGRVANRMDSRLAEIRAREVFGVLTVTNNLQVES
jgi:osmotically-inducible protein OsmY